MSSARDEDVLKGSSARLWSLIEQRTRAEADTVALDQRIWDLFGEEWAIVCTDLAGFSRQVARFGIIHFLQVIHEQKRLLLPIVERHDGILIKVEADSFLLLFKKPTAALACAIAMQRACNAINVRRAAEEQIVLCVGLGFGRLLKIGDEDVFGHEVNLASKLGEDTAKADEILVTHAARHAIGEAPGVTWEELEVTFAGETSCWRARFA
ncbi:MAG: putative adenylate/guanylate cyclase [Deltaproteobacteria bacterium]|nr:putative adenylate/guanylate cyclase [Deltaproteobacteria bacterium]